MLLRQARLFDGISPSAIFFNDLHLVCHDEVGAPAA